MTMSRWWLALGACSSSAAALPLCAGCQDGAISRRDLRIMRFSCSAPKGARGRLQDSVQCPFTSEEDR